MGNKLFLFPAPGTARSANGNSLNSTSFVGAIAACQAWPHLQVPADPQLVVRFLFALLLPQSLFVMLLQRGVKREDVLAYLRDRSLDYRVKEELLEFEDLGFSPLAPLLAERQVVDAQFIFRSAARDDVSWAVRRYGSLDRLRLFATAETEAEDVQERLAMPSSDISYDDLLDQCQFIGLFDYDDFFFCFSRKVSTNRLINSFRTVCQCQGVEAETATDRELRHKVFRRAKELAGLLGPKAGTAKLWFETLSSFREGL
ncbi:MAG: hypothetical protein JSV36_16110 [Anaerolineae bacterium]|nr:MAG: hypothetical protein JSV36_16110 [Anaerolineae bacterium]